MRFWLWENTKRLIEIRPLHHEGHEGHKGGKAAVAFRSKFNHGLDLVIQPRVSALLIFLAALFFYLYTLLPSMAWGDGIKLQSEAIAGESFVLAEMTPQEFSPDPFAFSRVGVAAWDHPLYIVLGNILVKGFHSVDPLWLVNAISAIFGAASMGLVFALTHRFTGSLFAAGYASLSLAVAHTFWWHSTTPEVYTLFVFLFLVSVSFFDQFERTGRYAFLGYSAFFWGLAASTHILAFLALPALGLYALIAGRYRGLQSTEARKLAVPALGYLAGFSLYLIQFIRMSANFSLGEIMGPVLGSTFLSQLGTVSPLLLGESFAGYLFFLLVQFNPVGVALGVSGLREAFRNPDRTRRKIVAFFVVFALFGIFYRVTDQFTFFIPSYVFWSILMGIGAARSLSRVPARRRVLLPGLLCSLLLATPFFYQALPRLAEKYGLSDASIGIPEIGVGLRNGLAYYIDPDKRGDRGAYEFGSETISGLAPDSIVIAEWYTDTDEYFILRYFTRVRPLRADVTVLGWPTRDPFSFDSRLVTEAIESSFPGRPIYLASLSERFYEGSSLVGKYCVLPESNLYRLYPKEAKGLSCLGKEAVTE